MVSRAVVAGAVGVGLAGVGVAAYMILKSRSSAAAPQLCVMPPGTPNCQPENCPVPPGETCESSYTFGFGELVQATVTPASGKTPVTVQGFYTDLAAPTSGVQPGTLFQWAAGQAYFTLDYGTSNTASAVSFYVVVTYSDGTKGTSNTVTITVSSSVTPPTCPTGDFVAPSSGCPSTNDPDPYNPGCCYSCPNTCTSDSECTVCGSGYACEGSPAACAQQQLGSVMTSVAGVLLNLSAFYNTGTYGCGVLGLSCCCKACTFGGNGNATGASITVTAVDKGGVAMPGVHLTANYSAVYFYTSDTQYGNISTTDFVTGADGSVTVYLHPNPGVMPPGYGSASDYPCDACGIGGDITCAPITKTGTILNGNPSDTIGFSAPDWGNLSAPAVLVNWKISWTERQMNCLPYCHCNC